MRPLLLAAFILCFPLVASADPIPLPPPTPTCPDGSRAPLLWPSREGYCEPLPCLGHCASETCAYVYRCVATVHGSPGPNQPVQDLPNVVSVCRYTSDCPENTRGAVAAYCMPRAHPAPGHPPGRMKLGWLPLASLGPLGLALGSITLLRRRRR